MKKKLALTVVAAVLLSACGHRDLTAPCPPMASLSAGPCEYRDINLAQADALPPVGS